VWEDGNTPLVHFAARRFRGRGQVEDVVQVGMIALIRAIDRFDPSRENAFTTFSIPYIIGEIKRYFRDSTWALHVLRRLQELRVELAQAKDRLHIRLGREPTVAELATHLHRSEEENLDGLTPANGYRNGLPRHGCRQQPRRRPGEEPVGVHRRDRPGDGTRGEDLPSLEPLVAELGERDGRSCRCVAWVSRVVNTFAHVPSAAHIRSLLWVPHESTSAGRSIHGETVLNIDAIAWIICR
jgi:RNA polymerase sigma-B factor